MSWLISAIICGVLHNVYTELDPAEVKKKFRELRDSTNTFRTEALNLRNQYRLVRNDYNTLRTLLTGEYNKIRQDVNSNQNKEKDRLNLLRNDENIVYAGLNDMKLKSTKEKHETLEKNLALLQEGIDKLVGNFKNKYTEFDNLRQEQLGIDEWVKEQIPLLNEKLDGDKELVNLMDDVKLVTRHVQAQQFNEEEKTRSDGNSGIKQIRNINSGGKSYFTNTYCGESFAAMYDSEYKNNLGLGEFVAVLNGVEFRTRNEDYELLQPVKDDTTYHKTVAIEHPSVPKEVVEAGSVADQIAEMKQWFKAFKHQNETIRKYKQYFPAVLCYLEGAYEVDKSNDNMNFEKNFYASYTGEKDSSLPYLPKTLMGFDDDGEPVEAKWNYRILCHKLKDDLPTELFELIKDITSEKRSDVDEDDVISSTIARFQLSGRDYQEVKRDRAIDYSFIDHLMEQIPGKDNYGYRNYAEGFQKSNILHPTTGRKLNAAYYHRAYKLGEADAMGTSKAQRGFSDIYYAALTKSTNKVVTTSYKDKNEEIKTKVSFAVPIEIVYLTPLRNWNPYNLPNTQDCQTPAEFCTNETLTQENDKIKSVQVDDSTKYVYSSGVKIMMEDIPDVGVIRQRYPIMPVYCEGSSLSKKINAIETMVREAKIHAKPASKPYSTGVSSNDKRHTHIINIPITEYKKLIADPELTLEITTGYTRDHNHVLTLQYDSVAKAIRITKCNSISSYNDPNCFCWDGHHFTLLTSKLTVEE